MQAIGCILFAIYGVAQFVAAWLGLGYYMGPFLAGVIIAASLFFRFTLPITVASFLGALYVWEWHWALALIFAAPGLLLVIPSILGSLIDQGRRVSRR